MGEKGKSGTPVFPVVGGKRCGQGEGVVERSRLPLRGEGKWDCVVSHCFPEI